MNRNELQRRVDAYLKESGDGITVSRRFLENLRDAMEGAQIDGYALRTQRVDLIYRNQVVFATDMVVVDGTSINIDITNIVPVQQHHVYQPKALACMPHKELNAWAATSEYKAEKQVLAHYIQLTLDRSGWIG